MGGVVARPLDVAGDLDDRELRVDLFAEDLETGGLGQPGLLENAPPLLVREVDIDVEALGGAREDEGRSAQVALGMVAIRSSVRVMVAEATRARPLSERAHSGVDQVPIRCESADEVDYFWDALLADGGEPSQCGWLKDRFGLSWQVVPDQLIILSVPNRRRRSASCRRCSRCRRSTWPGSTPPTPGRSGRPPGRPEGGASRATTASALGAEVLERARLVVDGRVPGGAHHPPPRHLAAVVRHHLARRRGPRASRSRPRHRRRSCPARAGSRRRPRAPPRRSRRRLRHGRRQSVSAPRFSPYGVSPTTVEADRLKNSSGPSSPDSQTTVSRWKPRGAPRRRAPGPRTGRRRRPGPRRRR